MKIRTLLFVLAIALSSCDRVVPNMPIGSSENYFKKNVEASIEFADAHTTIYSVFINKGLDSYYRYFYFTDGKLVRIDNGTYLGKTYLKK